jgi:hypothetical protein
LFVQNAKPSVSPSIAPSLVLALFHHTDGLLPLPSKFTTLVEPELADKVWENAVPPGVESYPLFPALKLPLTTNLLLGPVVPIPTLPLFKIVNLADEIGLEAILELLAARNKLPL